MAGPIGAGGSDGLLAINAALAAASPFELRDPLSLETHARNFGRRPSDLQIPCYAPDDTLFAK